MKTFAILALCAVLYFELSHGLNLELLKYRVRREASKLEEVDPELEKIHQTARQGIITIGKSTVESFTAVFKTVIEQAKKDNLEGEDVVKIQELVDAGQAALDRGIKDDDAVARLFEVFGKFVEVANKFNELEDPTDTQLELKRILDENNSSLIAIKFMTDFLIVRSNLDESVKAHIEGLSEAEKEKQKDLIEWYATFQKAEGTDDLIVTTISFFVFFEDEKED